MTRLSRQFLVLCALFGFTGMAGATFHLVQIDQLFSNADGTIQFVELTAYSGGQQFVAGHTITSAQGGVTKSFSFPTNLPGDTAMSGGVYGGTTYRSFLVATQGFAALNLVTPDYIVPNGFLFTSNGRVVYGEGADTIAYATLPTDGSLALNRGGSTGSNSAKNFAGVTGSVLAADYTGAWASPSESGWGLSIVRGNTGAYGIVMYNYNQSSVPAWYFMSGGSMNGSTYTGPVTNFSGPWFGSAFNSMPVSSTPAGTVTINFTDPTNAMLSFTINGTTVSNKSISKLQF